MTLVVGSPSPGTRPYATLSEHATLHAPITDDQLSNTVGSPKNEASPAPFLPRSTLEQVEIFSL